MKTLHETIEILESKFSIKEQKIQRSNLAFVTVPKELAVSAVAYCKDYLNYTHLVFLTAVDYPERNQFILQYMLHNFQDNTDMGIKVSVEREKSSMESIHHLWKQAATYQRELKEMFGIDFPGSPGVDDPFILESWNGIPPMRREFDTKKYSEEHFFSRPGRSTKDPAQHMQETLYPEGAH